MAKIAFIIPTIRDISLYGGSITSIQKNGLSYDVHLGTNIKEDKKEGNVYFHADKRLDGPISSLNDVINKIKDDYDYFISFTDETRIIDDWEPILDVIDSALLGVTALRTTGFPCYLPTYGEPDSPPYDYGQIVIMRFPAFNQRFLEAGEGKFFNEHFKFAAADLWLSYWLTQMGQKCEECNIRLYTVPSQPRDTPQKIEMVRKDLYTFFDLVNKHHTTSELSYNMSPL